MAKEPLTEQDIHDLLTRVQIEPSSDFKAELRGWLRQRLQKARANGYHSSWHLGGANARYLYKGRDNMKKITPLAAVLSLAFLVVLAVGFGIMLAKSPQEGSFASAGEETATPELIEDTEVIPSPTVEAATATPTPASTPTAIPLPPGTDPDSMAIGAQLDILIRSLNPEFYTYNEIWVDDDGVTVREARYYSNDSFVILTERMVADQPLPQGEEIVLVYLPVILVRGLEGEALLTLDTLQDGISRPVLGGGGGGGGGDVIEMTQGPHLFPEVIAYTDGSMVVWNMDDEQVSILTNLPEDDLMDIARLAMEIQIGGLHVEVPEFGPIPEVKWFDYPGLNIAYSYSSSGLIFEPLQPHYLPEVLVASQDDEIQGAVAVGNDDGTSVELQIYNAKSEEFVLIRQRLPIMGEILPRSDGDEDVKVNGMPAVLRENPECSLMVPDPDAEAAMKELVCTDGWSLIWLAENLSLEVIVNNLPQSEALQIANNLYSD